jgi:hypothetical protein
VFGLDPDQTPEFHSPVVIRREVTVADGHAGHAGRIDLTVSFGEQLALVVEIKKTDAESADTRKGAGYNTSFSPCAPRVLLAVSGKQETYAGNFRLVTWGHVSTAIRSLPRTLCQEHAIILAALILGFVGAVEGNLLGFSAQDIRRLMDGMPVPVSAAIGQHIEQWLQKEDMDGSNE